MARISIATTVLVVGLAAPGAAFADDGYFGRGFGAVSSAMGGTGVAYANSLMGGFALNPAGLARFDSPRFEVALEMFRPEFSLSSVVAAPGGTGVGGSSASNDDWRGIPAFAVAAPISDRVVLGLALRTMAGFGVDYTASLDNPVLLPQPLGLGAVNSRYSLLSITPAVAWKVNDDLWLGVNAKAQRASLDLRPVPFAAFQPDGASSFAAFPATAGSSGAWGTGMGVGLAYRSNGFYAAVNYQTPTWFQDFEWDAVWPLPGLPENGAPETIGYNLRLPAVAGFGVAYAPSETTVVEFDARRIMYGKSKGFEREDPDAPVPDSGAVTALGWESIWEFAVGAQVGIGDTVLLRAGYRHRDGPVPADLLWQNTATPAASENVVSAGLGLRLGGGFDLDVAYFRALDSDQSGPMYGLPGVATGVVTSEFSQSSLLMQLALTPGRD